MNSQCYNLLPVVDDAELERRLWSAKLRKGDVSAETNFRQVGKTTVPSCRVTLPKTKWAWNWEKIRYQPLLEAGDIVGFGTHLPSL